MIPTAFVKVVIVRTLEPVPVSVNPAELKVNPAVAIGAPKVTVPLGPTKVATSWLFHVVSFAELPSHQLLVVVSQGPVPPRFVGLFGSLPAAVRSLSQYRVLADRTARVNAVESTSHDERRLTNCGEIPLRFLVFLAMGVGITERGFARKIWSGGGTMENVRLQCR